MRKYLVLAMFLSTMALAACNAPVPTAPCSVKYSKQAADQLLQRARRTLVPGRPVSLSANNQEVTSLLSQSLEQLRTEGPDNLILPENPVVCFENGKASLFGSLKIGNDTPIAALITFTASVSAGKPVFKVEQVQLGPVSVPPDLSQQLSSGINQLVLQYLDSVNFTEIRFTTGQVLVAGQLRTAP